MDGSSPHSLPALTISGLKKARDGLIAKAAALEAERRTVLTQIEAMEISLRALDPKVEIEGAKPLTAFKRDPSVDVGQVTRMVLRTLRLASQPLSSGEIVDSIMRERGVEMEDRAHRAVLKDRVGACLRKLRIRERVRSQDGGHWPLWAIITTADSDSTP